MNGTKINWGFGWLFLAAALVLFVDLSALRLPGIPGLETKATAAVYVYEKDSGGVPSAVGAGLSKLNDRGIVATTFEDDATNAQQQVPGQYKAALPAARAAGLPALVVSAGDRVLRTVAKPTTEEQVVEAAP